MHTSDRRVYISVGATTLLLSALIVASPWFTIGWGDVLPVLLALITILGVSIFPIVLLAQDKGYL